MKKYLDDPLAKVGQKTYARLENKIIAFLEFETDGLTYSKLHEKLKTRPSLSLYDAVLRRLLQSGILRRSPSGNFFHIANDPFRTWLTVEEVAESSGFSETYIRSLASRGLLSAEQIHGFWKFDDIVLEQLKKLPWRSKILNKPLSVRARASQ